MKNLIFGLFLLFVLSTSCEKIIVNPESKVNEYTVSGTLFEIDGKTPVKNKQVSLSRTYIPVLTNDPESNLGIDKTDENGKFSFTYKQIREADGQGLEIWANKVEGLYSSIDVVTCIPPNQNVEVFGSLEPQLKYSLNIKNQHSNKNDTLFFSYSFVSNFQERITGGIFTGISSLKKPFANYIILGYDSTYYFREIQVANCISEEYQLGSDFARIYNETELFVIYAIGSSEFGKVINEPFDNIQSKIPYQRKPFPEVSDLIIELKK